MRPKGKVRKLLNLFTWNLTRLRFPVKHKIELEKLGTDYGGWTIPKNILNEKSVCYLAGAGEDISFDISIAEKYHSQVFIFDPTPRAKIHFDELVKHVNNGEPMIVNNIPSDIYSVSKGNVGKLKFLEVGLWDKTEQLKFFVPQNPTEVSHSIVNLQQTENYFLASVKRLSEIMKELGHRSIDLLKLDIEGAEYKVIDSFLDDKLDIKVICIEFDEANSPLDFLYCLRLHKSIKKIINAGYSIVYKDNRYDYTFVRNDVLV
ncbi:MAG: FkbM family methyltransferase [bacterium]